MADSRNDFSDRASSFEVRFPPTQRTPMMTSANIITGKTKPASRPRFERNDLIVIVPLANQHDCPALAVKHHRSSDSIASPGPWGPALASGYSFDATRS